MALVDKWHKKLNEEGELKKAFPGKGNVRHAKLNHPRLGVEGFLVPAAKLPAESQLVGMTVSMLLLK